METSISVTVQPNANGAVLLRAIADSIEGAPAEDGLVKLSIQTSEPTEPKRGRGRPKKEAKVDLGDDEPEADDEVAEDETEADDDDEAAEDEAEDEETKPEPVKTRKGVKAAKGPTLDEVIKAFQEYAAKHSRDKAGAILAKYKVKSVRNLPPEKFPEILKRLGA